MTRSGPEDLLRKREQPPRATVKDLFFDLVFIVAFTAITNLLVADGTAGGRTFLTQAGKTLLVLLAVLMVWFVNAWIANLYDAWRSEIRLVITGATFGGLLMAVELPQAFGNRSLVFASAYVAIHVGRGLVLVPVLRGHEAQRRAVGVLLWFTVSALPWIVGAIVQENLRVALWTLAIVIDYTGAMLLWPAPKSERPQWPVAAEYLAERYRQFFMVALGASLLSASTTYSAKYLGDDGRHTVAFLVSAATTILLFRIYVYRAGELLPAAIAAAADPGRTVRRALLAHLLMVVGILATSAGYGLVIAHPSGRTDPAWIALVFGGPALFIVGRAGFERTVFGGVSRGRVIGLLILVVLAPAMRFVPPLAVATTAMAVLLKIAIVDAVRNRRHAPDLPSPPPSGPS